ncbi:MAG TPA: DinB family protein [Pyrinomonadaceae bacterium]|nr:DinB family protein [Pyrinomonadaceae bacterium]
MTYTSVAEIYEGIERTREQFYSRVEGLSDEQAGARTSPEGWSVADIAEHLALIERSLLRMMKGVLAQAEAAGGAGAMRPFSLEHHEERARTEKYVAPERARPKGEARLADSLAHLRRSREELRALRPRIEATDLNAASYPHPAFGPLNLYEWLAFIGIHEARHLRQAEALLGV